MSTTTRKQMFLEKINDSSFSAPVPITVEEEILDGISGGSGGGGGDGFEFVITTTDNGSTFTANHTFEDIKNAINDKKHIYGKLVFDSETQMDVYSLLYGGSGYAGEDLSVCHFIGFMSAQPNSLMILGFAIDRGNLISFDNKVISYDS